MDKSSVSGLYETLERVRQIATEMRGPVILGGLKAAANVVAEEARVLVPVSPPSRKGRKRYGLKAGDLKASIRVTDGYIDKSGLATVRVLAGGGKIFYAAMVEYGTAAHWITVDESQRPTRTDRRGNIKPYSMRTLNKMAARGSLKIGQNFVGASVAHPGARKRPFMRPALDNKKEESQRAMVAYINKRIDRILSAKQPMRKAA